MNIAYQPLLAVIFLLFITTSCIREDDGNCGINVRFVYDYNILSANAFEDQVDQVTLYVFGEDGILVRQYTENPTLLNNGFNIRLTDLKRGNYHFVAWAQSKHITSDQSFFSIPELKAGASSIDELTYLMKREGASGFQLHELNNFLVGMVDVVIDDNSSYIILNLKKVTNKIKVVILPYTPGGNLDVTDYEISIIDKMGNGHINYDYITLPDNQITYLPYYKANLGPKDVDDLLPGEIDKAAVVEINTSRLIVENAPRLRIVDKRMRKEIVSMNLPWVFSLTEMENNKNWSLQEYLDRQDKYTIMLFFDDKTWMYTSLIINGWVVNIKDIDL